jgi:predicted transport protein
MSDIKLFRTENGQVQQLEGRSVAVEKSIQNLIEKHLDAFLGVRFLASEFSTGPKHGGRIDTLGLDENGYPVIIEYKRSLNENVINQGLFYLDWLMDHRGNFELLVRKELGEEAAGDLDWSGPRLLCIAGDFTKYDGHAIRQINRNIELLRYQRYGEELLLLELVNATSTEESTGKTSTGDSEPSSIGSYKTVTEYLDQAGPELSDLYETLKAFCLALGDDVQQKTLKYYFAFKRIKNFACVEIHPSSGQILVFVKADYDNPELHERIEQDDALRDVREIGHYGTGNLEMRLESNGDFERTQDLIAASYERS